MGNAVMGFPRWSQNVTSFSGGSWDPSYPVTNLNILPLSRVARTLDATTASTTFTATMDKLRPVQLIGLVGHNLSLDAQMRVLIYNDFVGSSLVYDSAWFDVWPPVYTIDALEWENDGWWSGKYSFDEIDGYTWTRPLWLDKIYMAGLILFLFNDTANSDGFVEIGMLEIAQGWQCSVNFEVGSQYGFRFRSSSTEAWGGSKYFEYRDKPRVFKGQIKYLGQDEVMTQAFEQQRQMDLDTPFLWVPNPDATISLLREAFLARNADPGLLGYALQDFGSVPLTVEEVL